jgi:small nuclear ribonucleoprotein (snRNP)-like protein
MKRYLSLSAALLLGSTSLALAAADTIEGEITGIDEFANTVTVDAHPAVQVPEHHLLGLQVGDRVILHVEERDGQLIATNVVEDVGGAAAEVTVAPTDPAVTATDPAVTATDPAVTATDPAVTAERPAAPGTDLTPGVMGHTFEGSITGIDQHALTVTVDASPEIHVPEHEIVGLEMGQRVIINADEQDGRLVAANVITPTGPTESGGVGDAPGGDGTEGAGGSTTQ